MTTTMSDAAPSRKRAFPVPLFLTAALLFAADQVTKAWVFGNLPLGTYHPPGAITVVDGFFYIVHIGNEGAAWGLFSGQSGWLTLFAIVALAAIYRFRHSLELHRTSHQYTFGLLIGGVLGNLVDRLLHGHVVDFLDFHLPVAIPGLLPDGRYPAFNLADCGIVVGVFVYLILSFRHPPGAPHTDA